MPLRNRTATLFNRPIPSFARLLIFSAYHRLLAGYIASRAEPRNRALAHIVAVGQFLQRSALRAPFGGLFLLRRCQRRGASHVLSLGLGAAPAFGGTGADEIALNIGEASEYGQHQAPGAGAGVSPRLRQ